VFIGVVLKTPATILSRDGKGAGAPETNLLECFCRERAECPGSNRSVTVAAQHAVFASTQTLVFIPQRVAAGHLFFICVKRRPILTL
jgi:hypothetical protein